MRTENKNENVNENDIEIETAEELGGGLYEYR